MGEIKIVVSDETEKIIEDITDKIGIKKTEYVKELVVENLKKLNSGIKKWGKIFLFCLQFCFYLNLLD